jgi:hypothetical protein
LPCIFGHRPLWHQQRPFDRHRRPDAAELARPQQIVGIGEQGGDLEGAGRNVNLAVQHRDLALVPIDGTVDQDEIERHVLRGLAGRTGGRRDLQVFLFADVEIHLDRIDRRHGGQFGRMLGLSRSPIWALAMPAMPVIGEVIWVKPRLSLAVLSVASAASSAPPLADWWAPVASSRSFWLTAFFSASGLTRARLAVVVSKTGHLLGADPGRLVNCGLERARVDLEQQLALLHQIAFAVVLLDQVAGHLRPDGRVDVAVHRTHPFHVDRHIALHRLDDLHDRVGWRWHALFLVTAGQEQRRRAGQRCDAMARADSPGHGDDTVRTGGQGWMQSSAVSWHGWMLG